MRKVKPTPPPPPKITNAEELGQLVRAARTASGMTLEEAALTMNVAKQTLQNVEHGTGTVTLALVFNIMNSLGIRLHWQLPSELAALANPDEA